jgi:hypothetical protein
MNEYPSKIGRFTAIFFGTILASLTLVTSLAWNTAVESYIQNNPTLRSKGKWAYAIAITLFTVFYSMLFSYLISREGVNKLYKSTTKLLRF